MREGGTVQPRADENAMHPSQQQVFQAEARQAQSVGTGMQTAVNASGAHVPLRGTGHDQVASAEATLK
jgi:hypothetical protein